MPQVGRTIKLLACSLFEWKVEIVLLLTDPRRFPALDNLYDPPPPHISHLVAIPYLSQTLLPATDFGFIDAPLPRLTCKNKEEKKGQMREFLLTRMHDQQKFSRAFSNSGRKT